MPEEVDSFYGVAGDLYHTYKKQRSRRWRTPAIIFGSLAALLLLDILMLLFFKVDAVRSAWWTGDGRAIVYAKALGAALDYATDVTYRQIGGDEVRAYSLDTGRSEKIMARDFDGRLAAYQGHMDGNVVWMVKTSPRRSSVFVFRLDDRLTPLSWKFEGPDTALMIARGRKALVCRDRGDVGLLEMGGDPLYVFHASEPRTLCESGFSGLASQGARAFFAEKTAKGTNVYVWDRRYGKALQITTMTQPLAHLTCDPLGKYSVLVMRALGGPKEYELWLGDTVSGKFKPFHKSKFGFQAVQWSNDAKLLAFASLTKVLLFSPANSKPLGSYDALGARSLAFTPDNRLLFYNVGTTLFSIDLASGQVTKVPVEIPPFGVLAASPAGKYLLLRTSLETGGPSFGLYLFDYGKNELKKIEGASLSHAAASFFAYRWYVAVRNFVTGRKKKT